MIAYDGGRTVAPFPGAEGVGGALGRARAGCDPEPADGARLDLDVGLAGAETAVATYDGCADGVDVQLDTIEGGQHVPGLDHEAFGVDVIDWLLDHAR